MRLDEIGWLTVITLRCKNSKLLLVNIFRHLQGGGVRRGRERRAGGGGGNENVLVLTTFMIMWAKIQALYLVCLAANIEEVFRCVLESLYEGLSVGPLFSNHFFFISDFY